MWAERSLGGGVLPETVDGSLNVFSTTSVFMQGERSQVCGVREPQQNWQRARIASPNFIPLPTSRRKTACIPPNTAMKHNPQLTHKKTLLSVDARR